MTITQLNTPTGRFYEIAGVLYPSVTNILQATMPPEQKQRLEKWRQKNETKREEAANRGTKIHELIAAQLHNLPIKCPDELLEFWQPVRQVVAAIAHPIAIEKAVYHPELKYAGTLDLVAHWQGRVTLFDWKTSYRMKRLTWLGDAPLQLAAYKAAFESIAEIRVQQAAVVVISPNRTQMFEIEVERHWEAWTKRLKMYHYFREVADML